MLLDTLKILVLTYSYWTTFTKIITHEIFFFNFYSMFTWRATLFKSIICDTLVRIIMSFLNSWKFSATFLLKNASLFSLLFSYDTFIKIVKQLFSN